MYPPCNRGKILWMHSGQPRIQGQCWIYPCHHRNETPNINKGIAKPHWQFDVDLTIPQDLSTQVDKVWHILQYPSPHSRAKQGQQTIYMDWMNQQGSWENEEATLILSFSDFSQLFTLTADASDVMCRWILMQEDNRKKDHSSFFTYF